MPAVGMRKSTRVFGARVLRSGRRLYTEPRLSGKYLRAADKENEWIELPNNSLDSGGDAGKRCKRAWHEIENKNENENGSAIDIVVESKMVECVPLVKIDDRMYGIEYKRKRKKIVLSSSDISEDKMFGKQFVRKSWRKKYGANELSETCREFHNNAGRCSELALIASECSYDNGYCISHFLNSVFKYMRRVRIGLQRLSAFLLSEPICGAFSSRGFLFLQDWISIKNPGFCIISGSRSSIPMFAVDFSAVPSCFMHLHSSMFLRPVQLACVLVMNSQRVTKIVEKVTDEEPSSQIPSGIDQSDGVMVASRIDGSEARELSQSAIRFPKSTVRNVHSRNGCNIKKMKTSLKRKRGRPPSVLRVQKASRALASDFLRCRHDIQSSSVTPSHILMSYAERTQDLGANSCSANILTIEMDKCYREEGAIITLEVSASEQWFLAVVRDGIYRYSLAAKNILRPCGCNRFTHAIIFTGDSGWKLEFPNKLDWAIFKELYKKCSERNVQVHATSILPIPGVREVSYPVDSNNVPFIRPDSYITFKGDELTRALEKRTANYDMDSDDEEWLNKFNNKFYAEKKLHELVMPESFELIIDALEKGIHYNPDDYTDDIAADIFCMDLERKEVVEAIRNYWIKKRRQKHSSLVRIFQFYQPRRMQVIPRSVLRKKRSFKRQGSQAGRGKQRTLLQAIVAEQDSLTAMAAERDVLEQHNIFLKKQEAKSAANASEVLAVLKRQQAQLLAENADMSTYRATMAMRIAEAAQITEALSTVTPSFL
ncbi:Enhancer of polycomb-like transcription factor protein [Forsythia ovata]|uniref:Enhancer of polycomb-like protein n=1 Tax=Forsythia ovata TaxID=205694 RepID=A0ABD1R0X7_9LAMI